MIVWITGAPGSGKTTLGRKLAVKMDAPLLDGDEVRKWLTPDCDFSRKGRKKHAERVYRVAKLMQPKDVIVAMVAHPPKPVDRLILVWTSCPRRPLWKGTKYKPPEYPDEVVMT